MLLLPHHHPMWNPRPGEQTRSQREECPMQTIEPRQVWAVVSLSDRERVLSAIVVASRDLMDREPGARQEIDNESR